MSRTRTSTVSLVVLFVWISLLAVAGVIYLTTYQKSTPAAATAQAPLTQQPAIDMQKYRAQAAELLRKNAPDSEELTPQQQDDLAKSLALPDQLYASLPLEKTEPAWYQTSPLKKTENRGPTAGDYNPETEMDRFNAWWDSQEQSKLEKQHWECKDLFGHNAGHCKNEYFSYQKTALPEILHQEFTENTQATGTFCYRNFKNGNCDKGYIRSQRAGDYTKITFCDAFVNGKCQGTYILKMKEPHCMCGPSVTELTITRSNGKWQYEFTEQTPHENSHTTTCTEYDPVANQCITGTYVQEPTEWVVTDENPEPPCATYEIAQGTLKPINVPVASAQGEKDSDFPSTPKPYLQLDQAISL